MIATMQFLVAVREPEPGRFVAMAPDLPGCHCASRSRSDVLAAITQEIILCVAELQVRGQSLPQPAAPIQHRQKPEFSNASWHVVDVALEPYL
jgi:predicted RNase H-like HicB family nuclease